MGRVLGDVQLHQQRPQHVGHRLGLRNPDQKLPDLCRWATGTTPFTPWMHGYRLRLVMAAIVTTVVSGLSMSPATCFLGQNCQWLPGPPIAGQALWCALPLVL